MIEISKYSGFCDLYDIIFVIDKYTEEELRNNIKIYINNEDTPLKIEGRKDLIPYYAHIPRYFYHDNKRKESVIYIDSESYLDRQERNILETYLKNILKIYNRHKRNKTEFNVDYAVKEICWYDYNKDAIIEIAKRVKDSGKKANIDNIHLKIYEYYRQKLADEMVENGLNLADYGYERFVRNKEVDDESVEK